MKRKAPTTYAPLFTFLGTGQDSILADGEIVVVNFAGLGGACAGIEDALHRPVTHAINHDPIAISLHRTNNPHTIHHVQDVWEVDPLEVAGGRRIALAWFSPDCKHFSKAKGGKPLDKNIRDLAWVATRYTALPDHLKPRMVFLENVEEFKTWGPLTEDGQPCKVRQGETFKEFVATIQSHGYEVEWRELRACDYGAPTIRKRLFLIARCDGEPIQWPAPTHGKPGSAGVESGALLPWRTAAECIDWSLPMPSIFDRKRPLVTATLRRVARGIKKFVLDTEQPFIVTANHAGPQFRGQDVHEPFKTITSAYDAHGLVDPLLAPLITNKQHQAPARSALTPLSTITTNHNKNEVVTGVLVGVGGRGVQARPKGMTEPVHTVTSKADMAFTAVHLTKFQQCSIGQEVKQPLDTVLSGATRFGTVAALMVKSGHYSNRTGEGGHFRGQPVSRPLSTITAGGNTPMVTTASLIHYYGAKQINEVRGQDMAQPLKTQTTENRHGLISASLVKHFGGYYEGSGSPVNAPVGTITANDHNGLLVSNLIQYNGAADAQDIGQPARTLSTVERFGLTCATLTRHFGTSHAADVAAPLGTITALGGGKTNIVTTTCLPGLTREQVDRARLVYALLNEHAPDALTAECHALQLVLTSVNGERYVIADIGMRMLTPRELARCQGFRDTYVLEHTAEGKPTSKAAQVRGVGNSVCPPIARAPVAAQFQPMQEAAD